MIFMSIISYVTKGGQYHQHQGYTLLCHLAKLSQKERNIFVHGIASSLPTTQTISHALLVSDAR